MAATQYVGAHYVPHGWEEWNQNTYYDGLFCVSYNYSWFIAKQNVPVGISPVNTEYWAPYSLTTGAQQELEEFVRRYNPTESLPDDFDIDTVMEPGEYFFNNYKNLIGGPRYQFITNYPKAIKGTLSVRRCADTFKPKYTILKRLTLDMEMPWVFTSSQTTNSGFSPWQIESSASFMTGALSSNIINNADVFEKLERSDITKYYYFGSGCTNTPAMQQYFNVIQTGGQAFAFGGIGSKNTVAMAYWDNSSNRWIGWQNIPNSSYMNNLGFSSMVITPVNTGESSGIYFYRVWRSNLNNVTRSAFLTLICNSAGNYALDVVKIQQSNAIMNNISGTGVEREYSIGSNGELLIKSPDQYLDIKIISTNAMYGATTNRSPIFNTAHNPYVMPIEYGEPMTIPEDGSDIPVNIPEIT